MKEHTSFLQSADGLSIFYRYVLPAKPAAAVILIHGYAEHSGRYGWVMETLAGKGFAAYAMDCRGHGRSAKVLADLDSVDKVLGDLRALQAAVREALPQAPVFLLGHSLGGTLALLYALRFQEELRGLVLSAPTATLPDYASPFLVKISALLARLFPLLPVQDFNYKTLSRDPEVIRRVVEDPLYYKGKIRARTGYEILRAIREVEANLEQVRLPVLLLQGGEDSIVGSHDAELVDKKAASPDKTLKIFPGLYHEILNEPEKQQVMDLILDWLQKKQW